MARPVTFDFQSLGYQSLTEGDRILASAPRRSGVFRIFDLRDNLILLEKTHNLAARIERFYSEDRDPRTLDLRAITGRIEFCLTDSPLETLYLLHSERRRWFPGAYRRMRTFPRFRLLKINRRQRFPRFYATRQVKPGVEYFGPFSSRAELERLKTELERAFKIRPCEYNIRGDDPYPDCIYFQMHTCSRPCNGDIGREEYLRDIEDAIAFIQGRDEAVLSALFDRIGVLADETRFEDAERLRRRAERIRRARKQHQETYFRIWDFDAVAVMDAGSTRRRKLAFVRGGRILGFEEHETEAIEQTVAASLDARYTGAEHAGPAEDCYEDFCLICNFMLHPVQSVQLYPLMDHIRTPAEIARRINRRQEKRASPEWRRDREA